MQSPIEQPRYRTIIPTRTQPGNVDVIVTHIDIVVITYRSVTVSTDFRGHIHKVTVFGVTKGFNITLFCSTAKSSSNIVCECVREVFTSVLPVCFITVTTCGMFSEESINEFPDVSERILNTSVNRNINIVSSTIRVYVLNSNLTTAIS